MQIENVLSIYKFVNKGEKKSLTFIVTENIYNGFIDIFNDKNPLHTSLEFAVSKGYNDRVMHGNILSGFLSYFIGETLPTQNVIIHNQYISFNNPVYLNDKLEFEAIVDEVYDSVNAVKFKFFFRNTSGKNVAKGFIQIGLI